MNNEMRAEAPITETELAAVAKKFRVASGRNRAEAARELGVARPTLIGAEEKPALSLTKLRLRMIEAYSPYRVSGPYFRLDPK